ncbi:MAG: thermonuclease family protein [Acidimicrobiia bacterium]|nr:thermonuclease family protein [Acidimicrobiia bacterium]
MRRVLVVVEAAALIGSIVAGSIVAGSIVAAPAGSRSDGLDTTVTDVVDGDTIRVDGGALVRLIGIDTPEVSGPYRDEECFGREASRRTTALIPRGTKVKLVFDVEHRDRYDRLLAYVHRVSDGLFVNASLVRDGYAASLTVPPNVHDAERFRRLQREAREKQRGLWKAC